MSDKALSHKMCSVCNYELQADGLIEGGFVPCEYCALRRWNTASQSALEFIRDLAKEGYEDKQLTPGTEIVLRHIIRRAEEALK
jgi:hypothetical protein